VGIWWSTILGLVLSAWAVRSPLHLGLAWIYEADFFASRSGAVRGRPGQAERTSKRSQSRADEVVMAKTSTLKGGTTAALRDFGRVFVCFGSVASDQSRQQPRAMSALPPIATELVRRNEVTLCATSRHMQRSKMMSSCCVRIPSFPLDLQGSTVVIRRREESPGSDAGSCPRRAPPDGLVRLH
jgi:hypothetical protein